MVSSQPHPVYIIDAVRTIIGHPFKSLRSYNAVTLAALAIKGLLARGKCKPSEVTSVILGNVVSSGLHQNMARQAALKGGLPADVHAFSVNEVCGSGLAAVILASQVIRLAEADCCLAGGAESATHAPFLLDRSRLGEERQKEDGVDSIQIDGLFCGMTKERMGDLAEALAARHHIMRQDQDAFALESHRKAVAAVAEGAFKDEIVALENARHAFILKDDHPRQDASLESLAYCPPAFHPSGTITAGNASSVCDGAAVVCLASGAFVKENKSEPLGRLLGAVSISGDPAKSFETDVAAIRACCQRTGVDLRDIDLFEIAEAFSAQALVTQKILDIPQDRFNISGGDVALGHPLGSAGARLLVTLVHGLKRKKLNKGLACISFGGGSALAMIVERLG